MCIRDRICTIGKSQVDGNIQTSVVKIITGSIFRLDHVRQFGIGSNSDIEVIIQYIVAVTMIVGGTLDTRDI